MIGETKVLLKANCPVIQDGCEVVITELWNFPATSSQFVTIRDLHNVNVNHHGKPEPILSTVRLTENTFEEGV
ncbi:hypothetical protein FDH01_gp155 [Acinetobacter phage vB_AbaM_ME3]|uniref:Uncharacterized protein n=1 Tax=Acinetobacter phage vB_AbaM_ME3 TaxID=1837876 RepID=A0A172Q0V3_9CAUD|nr:hypothetical protein FDH01_gp155 [Acinetobacter phage vB_AbaM_ME3]AND75467.1 hypothetical protein ME3_306 [Acinetobacter phage vB_AbaM_ME3]